MTHANRSRRIVALLAAYVVALQALLLPLSVAAGAAFDTGSLCVSSPADGSSPPTGHDSGCGCAAGCGMQCCAQSLAGPPPALVAPGLTQAVALLPARLLSPSVRPADRSPHAPRAPPAA